MLNVQRADDFHKEQMIKEKEGGEMGKGVDYLACEKISGSQIWN